MSSIKLSSLALLTLCLSLFACGEEVDTHARGKCESLVVTYCDHVVSCASAAQLLSDDFTVSDLRDECETVANRSASCDDAVQVSKTFNACIDDSSTISCSVITNQLLGTRDQEARYLDILPSSCAGAVLYVED